MAYDEMERALMDKVWNGYVLMCGVTGAFVLGVILGSLGFVWDAFWIFLGFWGAWCVGFIMGGRK